MLNEDSDFSQINIVSDEALWWQFNNEYCRYWSDHNNEVLQEARDNHKNWLYEVIYVTMASSSFISLEKRKEEASLSMESDVKRC